MESLSPESVWLLVGMWTFALAFIASNIFWFYQYNIILNKFMSRNYGEYLQAEASVKEGSESAYDQVDEGQALMENIEFKERINALNNMWGFDVKKG